MRDKTKYYAVFCNKEQGNFKIKKRKQFKDTAEMVNYAKGKYFPNYRYPTWTQGNKVFFLFEVDKSTQLSFRKLEKATYSAKNVNVAVGRNTIEQIVRGVGKKPSGINWFSIILGVIIGLLLGLYIQPLITEAMA